MTQMKAVDWAVSLPVYSMNFHQFLSWLERDVENYQENIVEFVKEYVPQNDEHRYFNFCHFFRKELVTCLVGEEGDPSRIKYHFSDNKINGYVPYTYVEGDKPYMVLKRLPYCTVKDLAYYGNCDKELRLYSDSHVALMIRCNIKPVLEKIGVYDRFWSFNLCVGRLSLADYKLQLERGKKQAWKDIESSLQEMSALERGSQLWMQYQDILYNAEAEIEFYYETLEMMRFR